MIDPPSSRPRLQDRDERSSLDVEQARYLRRRVQFWRSVAGALLLGIVLVIVVVAERQSTLGSRCRVALEHYGRIAAQLRLEEAEPATLRLRWQYLDPAPQGFLPAHYQILFNNWTAATQDAEAIPLAVCSEPHGTLTGTGRNVLFRQGQRLEARWVDEGPGSELALHGAAAERSLLADR